MRQFGKILKFELNGYLKNKVFVGITVFLAIAITVAMFIPNITEFFKSDDTSTYEGELPVMLVYAENTELSSLVKQYFDNAFSNYNVKIADGTLSDLKNQIINGNAECAFAMNSASSYTYYVNNLSMQDFNTTIADTVLQEVFRVTAMIGNGISPEQANQIMSMQIESETATLGKDQMQNFFYTYIMIFALYMVILLYGQMVATNVATEKSSRAMEVLITSAKPTSMMFGKVLASCIAGLVQLIAVFGTALVFYNLNKNAWGDNRVIESLFNIPVGLYICSFSLCLVSLFTHSCMVRLARQHQSLRTSTLLYCR